MRTLTSLFIVLAAAVYAQSYAIKGPSAPKPYEANAMKELGDYLAKRIDGTLTVGGKSPVVFHVGDTEFAKANGFSSAQLQEEQWIIKSIDNNVILNGGGTRGALYAVYHFLEDHCDIHWWSEFEEYVPKASPLDLPALDAKGRPTFLYRDIYCYHVTDKRHPNYMPFAIRNRLNRAGDQTVSPSFGNAFDYGPPYHCHTFELYFPEKDYINEHPEYFSLLDGKRVGGAASQICLTNPELKKVFLEKLFAYIKQGDEEAAKRNAAPPRIYDVSMNDIRNRFCQCPECRAEIEKYGYSGYVLRFVNYMAENVAKVRPELFISTLAYYECEPPPKGGVKALDNVIVKFCDTQTNQAASILEEHNRKFREFIGVWARHAKNLFIWDYAITFSGIGTALPFASEFHYGDLFRTYHENNVTGVFWEHERIDRADMYELKFYLETKLMEDPYQDVEKLINVFMTRFYGAAAPYILKFRRELDRVRREKNGFIDWMCGYSAYFFITNDMLIEFNKLFEEAEEAVKDDATRLFHVQKARMGIDCIIPRRFVPVFYHGDKWKPNPKALSLSAEDAARRLFATFDKWTDNFVEGDILKRNMRRYTQMSMRKAVKCPAPKELEGRSFFDCYPANFSNEASSGVEIVDDAESPVGEAMRISVARSANDNMPFPVGVYDQGHEKTLARTVTTKIPDGNGYHWFKIPPTVMPEDGYVFVSGSWTIQQPIPDPYLSGRKFEAWVSVKHVGEQFHAGQGKPEYTYVDRIVFIEAE
ncbi:MAG: DUF4838 domain-containing protein [Victivallales bacterium]|nr:DUF4838 domain-containing protein [Victivallales bacterium]